MSESKQFLYRLNPLRPGMVMEGPSKEEESIMEKHVSYLADLTDKGLLLMAGRTQNADERTFGIVIFIADSERTARTIMNEDPAVVSGIMTAELFPFQVAFSGDAEGDSQAER
jgi:uncharacterized protein YciI